MTKNTASLRSSTAHANAEPIPPQRRRRASALIATGALVLAGGCSLGHDTEPRTCPPVTVRLGQVSLAAPEWSGIIDGTQQLTSAQVEDLTLDRHAIPTGIHLERSDSDVPDPDDSKLATLNRQLAELLHAGSDLTSDRRADVPEGTVWVYTLLDGVGYCGQGPNLPASPGGGTSTPN